MEIITTHITITDCLHNNTTEYTLNDLTRLITATFANRWLLTAKALFEDSLPSTSDSGDSLMKTHSRTGVDWLLPLPKTNSLLCIAFPLQHRTVPMENTRPRLLGNHATRQYRVASVSMKPIVVLGMAQPYPGYGCEQVNNCCQPYPGYDRCLWSNTSQYFHTLQGSFSFSYITTIWQNG
jgi:hypothetical protein